MLGAQRYIISILSSISQRLVSQPVSQSISQSVSQLDILVYTWYTTAMWILQYSSANCHNISNITSNRTRRRSCRKWSSSTQAMALLLSNWNHCSTYIYNIYINDYSLHWRWIWRNFRYSHLMQIDKMASFAASMPSHLIQTPDGPMLPPWTLLSSVWQAVPFQPLYVFPAPLTVHFQHSNMHKISQFPMVMLIYALFLSVYKIALQSHYILAGHMSWINNKMFYICNL